MKFTLTIPPKDIQTTYNQILKDTAQKSTIKGFRPGKAPLDVVEANLDKAKVYEQVINQLLPPVYADYLKTHNLHPITLPKIKLKEAQEGKPWLLEVEIAEKPEVKLGDYQSVIKKIKVDPKIHLPQPPKSTESPENQQLNLIFDALLKTCQVDVPPLLLEEEINHRLSHLMYQIEKLGLNLDSYTASLNKTTDQLRQEYAQAAEASLKLEFILEAIAIQEKLQASDTEVDAFVQKIDDPKIQAEVNAQPEKRHHLQVALTKRHVTEYLSNLTTSPIILPN